MIYIKAIAFPFTVEYMRVISASKLISQSNTRQSHIPASIFSMFLRQAKECQPHRHLTVHAFHCWESPQPVPITYSSFRHNSSKRGSLGFQSAAGQKRQMKDLVQEAGT